MDFVVSITKTRRHRDSIWVIVDRMTKYDHFIPVKSTYRADDVAKLYIDKIVRWHGILLSIISDRGAQFTSHLWRSFQKILGMQGVIRFVRKGKVSSRYVGPYEILQRVGELAYELALPVELDSVHLVFHVSMLKKCLGGDPSSILPVKVLRVDENLSYEEVPVEILDRQVKRLRNKEISTVKAL
ncbi:uncharacterized protein [Solanum lycopersicum]|uniref:uncharacterized protein n=1 Tax=Solanum lycopersicum TaxID=4081 RepID=UPI003749C2EF